MSNENNILNIPSDATSTGARPKSKASASERNTAIRTIHSRSGVVIEASRTCSKCHVTQPIEEFAHKRGVRAASCKACQNIASRAHYERNKKDRIEKISERNVIVTASRQPLVQAMNKNLTCSTCGMHVWVKDLTRASRHQLGEAKFRDQLENLEWSCRSKAHSGVAHTGPATWLAAVIDSLMPVDHALECIRQAVSITEEELQEALAAVIAMGVVFQPLEGWVQPR